LSLPVFAGKESRDITPPSFPVPPFSQEKNPLPLPLFNFPSQLYFVFPFFFFLRQGPFLPVFRHQNPSFFPFSPSFVFLSGFICGFGFPYYGLPTPLALYLHPRIV